MLHHLLGLFERRLAQCNILLLFPSLTLNRVSGTRTNVFMRFKTTMKEGLLMWRGDSPMRPNSDFISLGLQEGALIFR